MPYIFRHHLSCHGVKSILSNCIPQSLQVVLIWYKINNRFHPVLSDQHKDILIAIIVTKFISHTCPNTDESNCSLVGTIVSVLELKWEIVIQMLLLIYKSSPGNAF